MYVFQTLENCENGIWQTFDSLQTVEPHWAEEMYSRTAMERVIVTIL